MTNDYTTANKNQHTLEYSITTGLFGLLKNHPIQNRKPPRPYVAYVLLSHNL